MKEKEHEIDFFKSKKEKKKMSPFLKSVHTLFLAFFISQLFLSVGTLNHANTVIKNERFYQNENRAVVTEIYQSLNNKQYSVAEQKFNTLINSPIFEGRVLGVIAAQSIINNEEISNEQKHRVAASALAYNQTSDISSQSMNAMTCNIVDMTCRLFKPAINEEMAEYKKIAVNVIEEKLVPIKHWVATN